jgi:hypothetical protein
MRRKSRGSNLTYMLKLILGKNFMDCQNFLKTQKKCPNTRSNPSHITPKSLKMVFGIKKLIREAKKVTKRGQKVYK